MGSPVEIRKRIQSLRKSQDPQVALQSARKIGETFFLALSQLQDLKIALYRPLPGEMDLTVLASSLQKGGARLFYPRVADAQAKQLDFMEAPPGSTWIKGVYGIEEPSTTLPPVPASELDLIVVPGVAFSSAFERIGRGAGYYDRALKGASTALKVALAFDYQVLSSLPQHSEDQKVDWVLTERQDLRTSRVATWLQSR